MDLHELISALKDLALQLGRTPTSREFFRTVKASEGATTRAGGYITLLHAAGLEPSKYSNKKLDNTIFQKDINLHLDNYKPIRHEPRGPYPTMAIISDGHAPFFNQRVFEAFYKYIADNKPRYVIADGDMVDSYSHAKFPRSHNLFTPKEEHELARKMNEDMWLQVKKAYPEAECYQLLGNHCIRPLKRILESYPAAEDWIEKILQEYFTFDGVKTIFDHREELIIEDIAIHHGYRSQLGAHRDYTHMNCIVGHTHRGGVVFRQIKGKVIWELNCGVSGDAESKGLSYTSQKISDWTPGFGIVNIYGPQFIPVP